MGIKLETYDGNGNLVSTEDTRVISDMVEALKTQISAYRDSQILNNATVWFNGNEFDCDPNSRANIAGTVTFILCGQTLPEAFVWRDAHNNNISQNNSSMIQFGLLIAGYVEVVYETSWALKTALDNIAAQELDETTIKAELDAFDITENWPSNDLTPNVQHNY